MFSKGKIIIFSVFLLIIAIGSFFIFKDKDETEYVLADVEIGSLKQTVSEVGTVKAAKELNLNFLQPGEIAKILVSVGDKVKKGDVLSELNYSSLLIQEKEIKAGLEIANSNLVKLLRGASTEEIKISQAGVNQAEAAYNSAVKELNKTKIIVEESISQAKKNYDDLVSDLETDITPVEQAVISAQINLENTKALNQKTIDNNRDTIFITIENYLSVANTALDKINTILDDKDAKQVLSAKNTSYLLKTKEDYDKALLALEGASDFLETAESSNTKEDIVDSVNLFKEALDISYSALRNCYSALENTVVSSDFTQTELDAYKTSISSNQTSVNTGISSIQSAEQNYLSSILTYDTNVLSAEDSLNQANIKLQDTIKQAKNSLATAEASGNQQLVSAQNRVDSASEALSVAKAQFEKIKAPPAAEDISLARAQIKQAEASLELIQKRMDESKIKAPIDGTIIGVENEIGEQVSPSIAPISMMSENNFEVEVDVSEADIAKLKYNDPVEITLDAYGEDRKFYGKVYFIEPAETIIQGVIYYKVKISFNDDVTKDIADILKPGMTANVLITTALKPNVLMMPARAIIEKNGDGKFVRVYKEGVVKEVPVEIGLRGDNGMVEVKSGVKKGEEVVTYMKTSK
jgi:multidrug efflux pump subunit AcrA (membrane-fusion protein)